MQTVSEWWMWLTFFGFIIAMLWMDMFLLGGRKSHRVSTKEAAAWSVFWLLAALIFNFFFWLYLKHNYPIAIANQRGLEFFTGYLIEKSLSVENIFVFVMIFNYFVVPPEYQRRVLLYGVIGAIVMRVILIFLGLWAINQFSWVLYIFGIFLIFTAIKMLLVAGKTPDLSKNILLVWLNKKFKVSKDYHGEKFLIKIGKITYITPLLVVLILIEISDLIFAIDSVPTIFAITSDPFIVISSNIFAILGLRALYFLLANIVDRFYYLKYGLAILLIFIGCKMLISDWLKIPHIITLSIISFILIFSVGLSLYKTRNVKKS